MSMRTIVEFNHDKWMKIEDDPEGFVRAIRLMLNSGVSDAEDDHHEDNKRGALEKYGITTTPTHHHSTGAEVVLYLENGKEFYRRKF
jgi:hypothetical protein